MKQGYLDYEAAIILGIEESTIREIKLSLSNKKSMYYDLNTYMYIVKKQDEINSLGEISVLERLKSILYGIDEKEARIYSKNRKILNFYRDIQAQQQMSDEIIVTEEEIDAKIAEAFQRMLAGHNVGWFENATTEAELRAIVKKSLLGQKRGLLNAKKTLAIRHYYYGADKMDGIVTKELYKYAIESKREKNRKKAKYGR